MKKYLIILLLLEILFAQPDSRFDTFDWTLYCKSGSINSITEGFTYAYIASENAGILRWHLYQNRFDNPITTAQGLDDLQIFAVHFDKTTGMLWAASENNISYSYNGSGNWFSIIIDNTGLHKDALVEQIGSSDNFIWISIGNNFLKLDKVSGIVMGLQPIPDEQNISWSSKRERFFEFPPQLQNYIIMDGWMSNYNEFTDPNGRIVSPTTYYFGTNSEMFLGMDDGTIFIGDSQMKTFYPQEFGLNNTSITAFTKSDYPWIVGYDNFENEGITIFAQEQDEFDHIDFESEINFNQRSFYSIIETKDEIWLGSNAIISIYNKSDDFWREIGEANGIPNANITAFAEDDSSIWVGTTKGLVNLSKKK